MVVAVSNPDPGIAIGLLNFRFGSLFVKALLAPYFYKNAKLAVVSGQTALLTPMHRIGAIK